MNTKNEFSATIFGHTVSFSFSIIPAGAVEQVKQILQNKLDEINRLHSTESKKISLIKVLRDAKVSKILIDAGLDPMEGNQGVYVSLAWAKEWVEANFTSEALKNNQ